MVFLSKDWVDKYIHEMNIHGCTMFAWMAEAWFDIEVLEEGLHDIPLWVEEFVMRKMADHIIYGSTRKVLYSSMDWIGIYIT